MAHNVSNEYKQIIYSGDARNKLKLLFNNVELQDADRYCEKLTVKSRIIPNGAKIFNLNNFISKEADLILHDIDTSIIQNQVSISIGTLVGNSYEYVPIGIFNIENQPTNDKDKTTIKLRDNSVKFDFNYNAQPLIEQNGGVATKLQILQDICSQAGVTCNITSFIGYLDEIGVYDNTITAREYISRLAEQAGRIATINRSGELIFVDLNNLTTWEIPIEVVEKYENGTKFKIGRVVYEDGIIRYETPTSNDDTLFLDGSNNYINGELVKEQASSNNNTYYLQDSAETELIDFELEGKTEQDNEPTPDYPSELVSVGYGNLLENTATTQTINGITFTKNEDGTITANGTATANSQLLLARENNEYGNMYLSGCPSGGGSNYFINLSYLNENNVWQREQHETGNGLLITNSYPKIAVSLYIKSGFSCNNLIFKPMISKQLHTYIPYGKYGIEIKNTGKNLLEPNFQSSTSVGATITYTDDGWLVNGTLTSSYTYFIIYDKNLSAGTYTINGVSGAANNTYQLALYKSGTIYAYITTSSRTFTLTEDTQIAIRLYVYSNYGTFNNLLLPYQLEEGTQATEYEPYQSNTQLYVLDNPLRSNKDGTIKDLLYIKNGMLYVDRKIGKVVLDGSETELNCPTKYDNNTKAIIRYSKALDLAGSGTRTNLMSNNFVARSDVYADNSYIGFYANSSAYLNMAIKYDTIGATTSSTTTQILALAKTWLSTHNTEVQYELAEPYTEELGQVDIPSTYEGITYIDISSNISTNTYIQYRQNKTQLEAILENTNQFNIDSLKTGKILGNPAIDSYDLIRIVDGNKTYTTLATNDLVYTGVLINTFDTQIGEEAKEQNVFVNGEETFKKWARTSIDNVEGSISLQAGKIDKANGKINETNLIIEKDGALLNVLANNSNIDVQYDSAGNPLSGEVREVTTTTGFKFNAEGMTIEDTSSNFKALHRNTGTYYKEGDSIVGQYTKDGSKQKDLELFGVYYYGKNDFPDTPMFVAQLYTDENGEEAFGHFYNRGD